METLPTIYTESPSVALAEHVEIFEPNLAVDLPVVKMPFGDGRRWKIRDGDEDFDQEAIEGVLIRTEKWRIHWGREYDPNGDTESPPACYSTDGREGVGNNAPAGEPENWGIHDCADCPLNQWRSELDGVAGPDQEPVERNIPPVCRERRFAFVLTDDILPWKIDVPPSGLTAIRNYQQRFARKRGSDRLRPSDVRTKLSIERRDGRNRIRIQNLGPLSAEDRGAIEAYNAIIQPLLDEVRAASRRVREEFTATEGRGPEDAPPAVVKPKPKPAAPAKPRRRRAEPVEPEPVPAGAGSDATAPMPWDD